MTCTDTTIKFLSLQSRYLEQQLRKHPDWAEKTHWNVQKQPGLVCKEGQKAISSAKTLVELNHVCRIFRNKQMVRIAIRDLMNLATLGETLQDTSDLADVIVGSVLKWHAHQFIARYGKPIGNESGTVQTMMVLGMGKLGGQELNFSSDIDLIYVYNERGVTQGGRQSIENEMYFIRLAQALNKTLAEFTGDGIVYRVDMRLRPFGGAGPLVTTLASLENYYALHGRAWERYALVKARLMSGTPEDGAALFELLTHFVYRKYVDYSALESLRDLKRQINAKVKQNGMEDNVKLGPGGIREIEFIVQVFQLIHAGRIKELQGRALQPMLLCVGKHGFLPEGVVKQLMDAYVFLRRTENRIQMWNDQQDHDLPKDDEALLALAKAMGFVDVVEFFKTLSAHRQCVQSQFDTVFSEAGDDDTLEPAQCLWQLGNIVPSLENAENSKQYDQPDAITALVQKFKKTPKVIKLTNDASDRLDKVMPLLLNEVLALSDNSAAKNRQIEAFSQTLMVFESILRRSVYFVMLIENPPVLANLVKVCSSSPWVTEMLTKYPVLLDQLFQQGDEMLSLTADHLRQQAIDLQIAHQGDDETFMNELRQWRHLNVFSVAMSDMTNHLPLMRVSDYLTWIAEAVLESCVQYAWQAMLAKHGLPGGLKKVSLDDLPFLVLGYGKMGGEELGYSSDLDMVFLYDGVDDSVSSEGVNGTRSLENSIFFLRMGQKVISLMTTLMPTGMLYEVDARLRPNGNSGMLVTSFTHFKTYLQNKAWVWEHQALVRARAVSGGLRVKGAFKAFKDLFLQQARDAGAIKLDIVEMRHKMRKELDKSNTEYFNLKQGDGGIIDIEFMVQYWVLTQAHTMPSLTENAGNIVTLEQIKAGNLLDVDSANHLENIYISYRNRYHQLALHNEKAMIPNEDLAEERAFVSRIWMQVMQTE